MRNRTGRLLAVLLIGGSMNSYGQSAPAVTSPTATTATVSKASGQPQKINLLVPVQQMIKKLKKLEPTGDPDFDYAFVAKIHTQGTQELLTAINQTDLDSALAQAAKTMLSTAKKDIATITALLRDIKPTRPNAAFAKQQSRTIEAMSEKIKQSASTYKLTSMPDSNTVILLLDQRQDAINIATSYLQFGRNTGLRNFAQQSIEKAKLDIDVVRNSRKKAGDY